MRRRSLRLLVLVAVLLPAAVGVAPSTAAVPDPLINEFVFNHTGTDTHEYVEILGNPNTDCSSYWILEIEGDSTGAGVIDGVWQVGTTDANGFWTTGLLNNSIENGTVTLLLVEDFTGSAGQDLDTDNDGLLDAAPWTSIVDDVAVHDGGSSDRTYSGVVLAGGFDGVSFTPGGASRIPNGVDTDAVGDWVRNDFDGAGLPGFTGSPASGEALNTPGATNQLAVGVFDPVVNEFVFNHTGTDTHEYVEILGNPNTDCSSYWILEIEGDSTGAGVIDGVWQVGTTDANGFWTTGLLNNSIENGTVTLLLVEDFTGSAGQDLDTDNDGLLDAAPWTSIVDDVAVHDGGSSDRAYSGVVLAGGFDGVSFTPGGASRIPNGVDTDTVGDWVRNDFDGEGLPGFTGTPEVGEALNTPGATNAVVVPPPPPLVPICEIQGSGFASPYADQTVRTQGVVFADFDTGSMRGFFIQDEDCDGDPATSDGIFVYKGNTTDVVNAGDLVEVRGIVQEYYELTEISTSLSGITVLSGGSPLPARIDLNPPFDNAASRVYLESLEGMYVQMDDALVVGPTSYYDESWVVRSDLGIDRVFQDDVAGTGEIVGVDDGGLFEITPEAKVGDQVLGLQGALYYSFGAYVMELTAPPTLVAAPDPPKYADADQDGDVDLDDRAFIQSYLGQGVPPAPASADLNGDARVTGEDVAAFEHLWNTLRLAPVEFSVATFNLENLFDTVDEPGKDDPVPSPSSYASKLDKLAEAIHDELREPTIIGVQEAENQTVLDDLAARPEIEAVYAALLVEGPDARGIDVGLLYQTSRVTVLEYEQRQGCTPLVDGLGPDGNRDMENPQNDLTCDIDGDSVLDGNRLFSRPPLVVHLEVRSEAQGKGTAQTQELWVIVNHWKSKTEDTSTVKYTLPRRIQQATFVAKVVQDILSADPGADLIVLGDLNDFLNSQPLAKLTDVGLSDLLFEVPKPERYTYIYLGESEVLDHMLIGPDLWDEFRSVQPVHINADYPYDDYFEADSARRSSDHDPVLARFSLGH